MNELGVSEPIVQRQGIDRIIVQLPGVQNSAEVKDILGKVATLEFRLDGHAAQRRRGRADRARAARLQALHDDAASAGPILLKREVIATGDQLTNATSSIGAGGPAGRRQARLRAAATQMLQDHARQRRQAAWRWCSSRSAARPSRSTASR